MSLGIAALIFVLLLSVALANFLWAFGQSWPIRDKATLAHAVVGLTGATRVPRWRAFGIALLTLVAGIVGLALADPSAGGPTLTILGVVLAVVFAARGALGYTRWWQERAPEEPYRSLNRRNYSPLCLVIAAGFLALVLMRLL